MSDNLMSYEEAADELGISIHTMRSWVSAGRITFVKLGSRVMFLRKDLESFIQKHRVEANMPEGGLD